MRKSRDKAKQRQTETEQRVRTLTAENEKLNKKCDLLQKELNVLKGTYLLSFIEEPCRLGKSEDSCLSHIFCAKAVAVVRRFVHDKICCGKGTLTKETEDCKNCLFSGLFSNIGAALPPQFREFMDKQ